VIVVFSVAECIHGAVNNPLIADLAPPQLLGRYMALRTTAFQVGYLVGPALGSVVLSRAPAALWSAATILCAAAAAGFLRLERSIPPELAVAPGPERVRRKAFRVRWRTGMRVDDPLSPSAEPAPHQAPEASHAGEGRGRAR
jgi:MFS family permease